MASEAISYDKAELRAIMRSFKAMDDQAIAQTKKVSSQLAEYVKSKIVDAAGRTNNRLDNRVAAGARVSKSSKVGEIKN
jgi:hypothetical protein